MFLSKFPPRPQPDHDILIRFRFWEYVLTGDVRKMFLRIAMRLEDRKFLRYFWRDEENRVRLMECMSTNLTIR